MMATPARVLQRLALACLLATPAMQPGLAHAATLERPDAELRQILIDAINSSDSFQDRFDAEVWLTDMSRRLARQVGDPEEVVLRVLDGVLHHRLHLDDVGVAGEPTALRRIGRHAGDGVALLVGEGEINQPVGPDTYGYYAYDGDDILIGGIDNDYLDGGFDVAEGESEIVAGFHVEYSGMTFAVFFLAEYANMWLISALTALMFLGGWLSPFQGLTFLTDTPVIGLFFGDGVHWLLLKASFFMLLFFWFRATFPRYRYDQIMRLGWKVFIPITIVWILVVGLAVVYKMPPWWSA